MCVDYGLNTYYTILAPEDEFQSVRPFFSHLHLVNRLSGMYNVLFIPLGTMDILCEGDQLNFPGSLIVMIFT